MVRQTREHQTNTTQMEGETLREGRHETRRRWGGVSDAVLACTRDTAGCASDGAESLSTIFTDAGLPGPATAGAYQGGVLAPNGIIYAVPWAAGKVMRIDPQTDAVTYIGSGLSAYVGSVLALDGNVIGIPLHASSGGFFF